MKEISGLVDAIAPTETQRSPTLWELAAEYPRQILEIVPNPEHPDSSYAKVSVQFSPVTLKLMRSIPGAFWHKAGKTWRVPANSSRRLAEVLYVIVEEKVQRT